MTEINDDSCCNPITIELPRIFINESVCTSCGLCGELCPFGLPQPNSSGKYEIKKPELCTECSACQRNCPSQAISLQEQKGCGCLWDTKRRLKNPTSNNSCCG